MNQTNPKRENIYYLSGLFSLIVAFVIFKLQHLSLPFYWDEAWPFSHAVHKMYENGLSLLPDAIPTEISRGHPLLFHFLAAAWMKVFGTSLVAINAFPLFLSVLLIISIYMFGKKFLSRDAGLLAALIFCLQAVFLAQSSFLLLEVMLALLGIWTFYFYLTKQRIWYIVFATLLMMTKESGIVVVAVLSAWEIVRLLFLNKTYKKEVKTFLLNILIIVIPVFLVAIYFVVQKIIHGWFFFPLHVDFMSFTPGIIKTKFFIILNFIFFAQGRYIITLLILIALVVHLFIRKSKFIESKWEVMSLLTLFILAFAVFSSLNFLSNRYLLITLPPLALIFAHLMIESFKLMRGLLVLAIVMSVVILVIFNTKKINNHDDNLGYIDQVKVHQKMVDYCEQENLFDKSIYSHFLMRVNLTSPYAGYLSDTNKKFNKVVPEFSEDVDYCIFSAIEYYPVFDSVKLAAELEAVKEFRKNTAWVTLYKVISPQAPIDTAANALYEKRVRFYIDKIKKDSEWLKMVKKKAGKKNIPLDSMIRLDAIYMVEQEK